MAKSMGKKGTIGGPNTPRVHIIPCHDQGRTMPRPIYY
jgi:hypothetical protein